jgi:hypothetical protein
MSSEPEPQEEMNPRDPTVIDEIARRLGPGEDTPFALVDVLCGFYTQPRPGWWRLYRALDSADYIEGENKHVGRMDKVTTSRGDTIAYVKMGVSLTVYQNGQVSTTMKRQDVTSWHM